jgi:hypothetical protein
MQVQNRYSDGHDGRCAMGVIMSYFGWAGTTIECVFTIDVYESELSHVHYFGNSRD